MNSDQKDYSNLLKCDVCIVGTGIAGLALASKLSNSSIDTIVLESGDWSGDNGTNKLSLTKDVGLPYRTPKVGQNRGFGGTTELWGGQCTKLDPIDFEPRALFDDAGWPLLYSQLDTYYKQALKLFSLPESSLDHSTTNEFPLSGIPFDADTLRSTFSVFSPKRFLGRELKVEIKKAQNIRVVTNATVTELLEDKNGQGIEYAKYSSFSNQAGHIKAQYFILCCGPIEIPRLLLASKGKQSCGVGNQNDLVGRYLQDHLICSPAKIVTTDSRSLASHFELVHRGKHRWSQKLTLPEERKLKRGILNTSASVVFDYEGQELIEPLTRVYRALKSQKIRELNWSDLILLMKNPLGAIAYGGRNLGYTIPLLLQPKEIRLSCITEQAPNRTSRITLDEAKDGLGIPLPKINWKISDHERRTIECMVQTCSHEFKRLKLGEIHVEPWLADSGADFSSQVSPILHPTGTTRMGKCATEGVVDVDGSVFGAPNLFIASASVFPTSGHANPGLTIAALAIRLSDHLKSLFTNRRVGSDNPCENKHDAKSN